MEGSSLFDGLREQWKKEGKTDDARNMLRLGVTADFVVKVIGLRLVDVEQLEKQLDPA